MNRLTRNYIDVAPNIYAETTVFSGVSGAPIDERRLNEFASAYNIYVTQLKNGVIDLKLWRAARYAWDKLVEAVEREHIK